MEFGLITENWRGWDISVRD